MINIATALNKKYLRYTGVMLTSLCANNTVEHIRVFVLHHELDDDDFRLLEECLDSYDIEIVSLKIDRKLFDERLPHNMQWTIETYYRLLLLELLPQDVERLLYLDVDIIVNFSIDEFYYLDFCDDEIIVAENAGGLINANERLNQKQHEMLDPMFKQGFKYFNAGVLLLNISLLRQNYNFQTYLQAIEEWNYEMGAPDQDILNYVHWNKVGYIDPTIVNYFSRVAHEQGITYEQAKETIMILHFTDEKPWETRNYHYPIEQIWWDYAKLTPFYTELLEDFLKKTLEDHSVEEWIRDMIKQINETTEKCKQSMQINQKLLDMLKSKN